MMEFQDRGKYFADTNVGLLSDALFAFVGEFIGRGQFRCVYEFTLDPKNWVVKTEFADRSFANITEWQLWQDVKDTPGAKWFAPCRWISPGGTLLIQARTKPLKDQPAKIPWYFTDRKTENFGTYKSRLVCHDYAMTLLANPAQLTAPRMVKTSWS